MRANLFPVKFPRKQFYEYSVTIQLLSKADSQPKLSRAIKPAVFAALESSEQFKEYRAHVVHDRNQKLISTVELPQPLEVQVALSDPPAADEAKQTAYAVSVIFNTSLDTTQLISYVSSHSVHRKNTHL